jgi:hypothetical protein
MSEQPPADLDWSPLVPGGAAFRTHQLVVRSPARIELHPSIQARALIGVFASIGVIAVAIAVWGIIIDEPAAIVTAGVFVLTCSVLVLLLHRQLDNRSFFDAELGRCWSSRDAGDPRRLGPDPVPLSSIRALQNTSEVVIGPEGDYTAYELNLVLERGPRINVLDHGNLEHLHADATQIAALLRVPLWIEAHLTTGRELD